MTTRVRTIDFLPEIFKTKPNEQFLSGTLDVLTQQPNLQKLYGFVGSKFGYGVNSKDNYLTEPTKERSNYQLEPAVIFKKKDTNVPLELLTYSGLVDALTLAGSNAYEAGLFSNQFYSWDSFADLDKLVNYSEYYWMPGGLDPVTITNVDLTKSVTYNITSTPLAYEVRAKSELIGDHNPELTLVRGGTYFFNVDQDTPFYLQTSPDISGVELTRSNLSTREIFGLTNNGIKSGTLKFVVPLADEQADWALQYGLTADLATTLRFADIQAKPANEISIDGVTDLEGKTVLFTSASPGEKGQLVELFDTSGQAFDDAGFDSSIDTTINNSLFTITYVGDDANGYFIELVSAEELPINRSINIRGGAEFLGRSFVKNTYGEIMLVPVTTANLDTYYYRDGNIDTKYGVIKIVDRIDSNFINVDDIVGKATYLSPNGVTFTNGLCVQFAGNVFPAKYASDSYYVEGVGTSINLIPASELRVPEAFSSPISSPFDAQYFDTLSFGETEFFPKDKDYITISRNANNRNAWSRSNRWFHSSVLKATLKYNPNATAISDVLGNPDMMAKRPIIEFYPNLKLFNSGVNAKKNIAYINFTETDALSSVAGLDTFLPDGPISYLYDGARLVFAADANPEVRKTIYIAQFSETINTTTTQLSALSDITTNSDGSASATFSIPAQMNPYSVGKIFTVYGNLNTSFNGTFRVVGSTTTTVTLLYPVGIKGTWNVPLSYSVGTPPTPTETFFKTNFEITLVPSADGKVQYLDQVAVISGGTAGGKTFYFDGASWVQAQQKERVNQPPLFDLLDSNGNSLADQDFYPSSDFAGCTLFGFATGSGANDTELGFPVKYISVQNIGDLVFDISLSTQKFNYGLLGKSVTSPVNIGYVHDYSSNTEFTRALGWQTAVDESIQYQVFNMVYNAVPLAPMFICDVPMKDPVTSLWPTITVYVDNARIDFSKFTVTVANGKTTVELASAPNIGMTVDIMLLSDETSKIGYFQTPVNLDHNPYNVQIETLSLGDIRGHYKSIYNNAPNLSGSAFGANNYRDLGNLVPYGTRIIQNSAPLTLPASFLRNNNYNIFEALTFNSVEFAKYKAMMINALENNDFSYIQTDAMLLDEVVSIITEPKTETSPFFWSDMLPAKNIAASKTYNFKTVLDTSIFLLSQVYDFSSANYAGVIVYLTRKINNVVKTTQLTNGIDYEISHTEAKLTITKDLLPGDKVTINEYHQTYGNFVPNTPTKLGLYPAFVPEIAYDDTYVTPTYFIKGHDGSFTRLYGSYTNGVLEDARDRLLFEFENRIYNNLKVLHKTIAVSYADVVPGYFRSTSAEQDAFKTIYENHFLSWVGTNRLDFSTQFYDSTNELTWNFAGSKLKLDNSAITIGNWRGIYLWLFDTATPHTTPWEMLGISNKPTWWDTKYGAAPYTSDNLLMWQDIADGVVYNDGASYIIENRKRPGLMQIIPVDSQGNLLTPFTSCISSYDTATFKAGWKSSDMSPTEYAYRKSSTWPFDLVGLMVLQKPAKFFNLNLDLDYYQYSAEFNQYLVGNRLRTPPNNIKIYGTSETTAAHSYINWIVDYSTQFGVAGADEIRGIFDNTDVRLVYRMAGFTSKELIKFFTENSSSSSSNALMIPEDSYNILLHNNQPSDTVIYSSVIIQRTDAGYKVYGNKQTKAYFTVFTPISGLYEPVSVNGTTVEIAKTFYNTATTIPYGFEFTTVQSLLEFIKGYGLFLENQGMIFDDIENATELTWNQMLSEVLYWVQSGWEVGSTVNVNPAANNLSVNKENMIVQPMTLGKQNFVLNQNLLPIALNDLAIHRSGTSITIKALNSGDAISFFTANLSTIEHAVVFDNTTIFGDLIFDPVTGLKQQRLFVKGSKTAEWNGMVDSSGFIMSLDTITDWIPNAKYSKGLVVKYKNDYWMANKTIIQPSNVFNYNDWIKTSYDMVQQRMLPNQSTRSAEAALYYDKNRANLANDADLLSFSLIGYRPRDYMASADLDDSSQVNVFSSFIETKGTAQTVSGLNDITVKDDMIDYTVHENWAIKTGEYGGVLNHNFVQFGLSESKLSSNPSIVSIVRDVMVNGAQQVIQVYDAANYNRSLSSENFLPQLASDATNSLPSAGYVNVDDVIELGYSINDFSDAGIAGIYKDDYLWVANKDNTWDVYTPIPTGANVVSVVNNGNGTVTFTFDKSHGLLTNQAFGLISFDYRINGYHLIDAVPSLTTVTVTLTLASTVTTLTGNGLSFLLQSQRVKTPRDITSLPLMNSEYDTNHVWVDQAKTGDWKVYKKTNNYSHSEVTEGFVTSALGSSVAYVPGVGYLAGDSSLGLVSIYTSINDDGVYTPKTTFSYDETTFGTVIKHNGDVIVVTAPDNNLSQLFIYRNVSSEGLPIPVLEQVISIAGGTVGKAIALSGDGNYIYASVDDGSGEAVMMFSLDTRLLNTGSGALLSSDVIVGTNVFNVVGNRLSALKIGQRVSFVTSYSSIATLSATFNPQVTDAFDNIHASFRVSGDRRSLLSSGDVVSFSNSGANKNRLYNVLTTSYNSVTNTTQFYIEEQPVFWTDPAQAPVSAGSPVYKVAFASDTQYTVIAGSYDAVANVTRFYTSRNFKLSVASGAQVYISSLNYELVEFYPPNISWVYGDGYGSSLATNYDGSKLFVGSPKHDYSGSQNSTGLVYAYDRLYETFEVERDQSIGSIFVVRLPWNPSVSSKVYVNGKMLQANKFVILLNAIIFGPIGLFAGDLIKVSSDNMVLSATLVNDDVNNMRSGQMFGYAMDCNAEGSELITSAPFAITTDNKDGAVYRFTDPGKRYGAWVGSLPAALVEPTYLLINGYRVNLFNVSSLLTTVTTNTQYVMILPEEANAMPVTGKIGFRKIAGGASYDIGYRKSVPSDNNLSHSSPYYPYVAGKIWFGQDSIIGFPYSATCTPADTQLYTPLGVAANIATAINDAVITNIFAYESEGRLIIRLRDMSLAPSMNKLTLAVFNGNYWTMLGMLPYPLSQTITSPHDVQASTFGAAIKFNEANSFVVGAPTATRFMSTKFDFSNDENAHNDTVFDNNLTNFEDSLAAAGAVYMFDYIDSYDEALDNIGKYVYSQPCNDLTTSYGLNPMYGAALDFNHNTVMVGAPKFKPTVTGGKVVIYRNKSGSTNWRVHREPDQVVDISKINKVQLFNNVTDVTIMPLDYIDPLQGKLLGVVAQNLDYISSVDPASYNSAGATTGSVVWNGSQVGRMWFDTSNVRFLNYHQNDVAYNSKYWGQVFPGSDVAVYSWVESTVPPINYTGTGSVFNAVKYSVTFTTDSTDNLVPKYYFWVRNTNALNTKNGKTLPDQAVAQYITNPKDSGVAYFAPLRTNSFGLVNAYDFINGESTSIYIGFSITEHDTSGHTKFKLIRTDYADDFLPGFVDIRKGYTEPVGLYEKFIDSFSGEDSSGAVVPDPTLPALMQIGVSVRPRQSMFVNRLLALKNYLSYVNSVLIKFPVSELGNATFLYAASDEFDTSMYWDYVYWWDTGYSNTTRAATEVELYDDLSTVSAKEGLIVAVSKNAAGNREVYKYVSSSWVRIGLENGTVQFSNKLWNYNASSVGFGNEFFDSTSFDSHPALETRYVIRAINEQLFVGDLTTYRNKSLILMFEFIQSENIESHNYLPWLNKTSFADVSYNIRTLKQTPKYKADNTELLQGYINEVKPYRVVIKDFYAKYKVSDTIHGNISDFDLPSSFDPETNRFVSPQVVFGVPATAEQKAINDTVWSDSRYSNWKNNLGMGISSGETRLVTTLADYVDKFSIDVYVTNAYSLPVQGVLIVNDEKIGYTGIDRVTGKLSGVTRGAYQTSSSAYFEGTSVYMVVPGIIVLDAGLNYLLPPTVTAHIDTSVYPAPRKEAILEAIMNDDRLVEVRVIEAGEGYVVTPDIVITSSVDYTFDNFDTDLQDYTTLIDYAANSVFTTSDVILVTGDSVKVTSSSATGEMLIADGYYYVSVEVSGYGSTIKFYETHHDATQSSNGLALSNVANTTGFTFTVSIAARAVANMATSGARNISTTLKFDRVSYNSRVKTWEPNKFWSSPYTSVGNDASSSLDSSSNAILSSSQGVVLPIISVENDNGFAVVTVDYEYSGITPGQVNDAKLQFYKVTGAYVPAIVDGTDGKARIEIFRPKFGNGKISEIYTIKVISPGSIYVNDYTIRISGADLGGEDGKNDAVILVKVADQDTGAIQVATISGLASGIFADFYVRPLDGNRIAVFSEPTFSRRAPYNGFVWDGSLNSSQAFGAVGNDYAYMPEPISDDFIEKHDAVSLVSYAGVIWACLESNYDADFDPSKWQPLSVSDISLTALERIDGFYVPGPGMPPIDHQQLLKGITYPNPVYLGNSFAPEDELPLEIILSDNLFNKSSANVKGIVYVPPVYSTVEGETDVILIPANYVAVVETAHTITVLVRNENFTWDPVVLIDSPKKVTGIAYANETYVVTVDDNDTPMFVSFDSKKWISIGNSSTFDSLDFDDGSFDTSTIDLARAGLLSVNTIGDTFFATNTGIMKSTDGLVWNTPFTFGDRTYNLIRDVAFADIPGYVGYVAVGQGYVVTAGANTPAPTIGLASRILLSTTSEEWNQVTPVSVDYVPVALAVSDEIIVMVCEQGRILYSDNAFTWIEAGGISVSEDFVDVAYGNNMFVAIGNITQQGVSVIMTSTDGITWIDRSSEYIATTQLNHVYFDGTNFIISGDLGMLIQSSNGINWENILVVKVDDPSYTVQGNDFLFGYGPEELVAGVVNDKLTMRVNTAPGAYWNRDGSEEIWYYATGFNIIQKEYEIGADLTVDFDELVANGAGMSVFIIGDDGNLNRIYENITSPNVPYSFSANWKTKIITFNDASLVGASVLVEVYEFGNAVEKERANSENVPLILDETTGHSSIYTDLDFVATSIKPVAFAFSTEHQLRKLEYGVEYVDVSENGKVKLEFNTLYNQDTDYVVYTIPRTGKTAKNVDEHEVSIPETEFFTSGGTDFELSLSTTYDNTLHAIVEVDGKRLCVTDDYTIDGDSSVLTLVNAIEDGALLAVTMFNGTTRQYLSTTHSTVTGNATEYIVSFDAPAVPVPMAPMIFTNVNRTWVTIDGVRVHPSKLHFDDSNNLTISQAVLDGQIVCATAMVPSASPNSLSYRLEVDKTGNTVVYRQNIEDTTWLVKEINEVDDIIYVRDASFLIDIVETSSVVETTSNGRLVAFLNMVAPDISGVKVFDKTKMTQVPDNVVLLTQVQGRPAVVFTDFVDAGDELTMSVYQGDTIEVNGEKIHFTLANLENNTLSGIARGSYGSQVQIAHPLYSKVFSMSTAKIMNPAFYDTAWYEKTVYETHTWEVPLQLSNTDAAKFLKMNNI